MIKQWHKAAALQKRWQSNYWNWKGGSTVCWITFNIAWVVVFFYIVDISLVFPNWSIGVKTSEESLWKHSLQVQIFTVLCQSLCFDTEKCFFFALSLCSFQCCFQRSKVLKKSDNAAHILFWKGQQHVRRYIFDPSSTAETSLKQNFHKLSPSDHQSNCCACAVTWASACKKKKSRPQHPSPQLSVSSFRRAQLS